MLFQCVCKITIMSEKIVLDSLFSALVSKVAFEIDALLIDFERPENGKLNTNSWYKNVNSLGFLNDFFYIMLRHLLESINTNLDIAKSNC